MLHRRRADPADIFLDQLERASRTMQASCCQLRSCRKNHHGYWATDFGSLSQARYPTLHASAVELNQISASDEFESALDRLLQSLVLEFSAS